MAQDSGFFSGVLSPEETERAIDKEILGEKPDAATVLGGFLGKALGGGGYQKDPRMVEAVKMKALKDRVSSAAAEKGIDFQKDPTGYTKIVTAAAFEMGMPDIGLKAIQQGRQFELEERKMKNEEERTRALEAYYKGTVDNKGKGKKKPAQAGATDVDNTLKALMGKPELEGLPGKKMANLSVKIAQEIEALQNQDPDLSWNDAYDMAYEKELPKIKPARKRGWFDTGKVSDWKDMLPGTDEAADYDDSGGPITEEMATKPSEKPKAASNTVKVKSPDGKVGTIPRSQLKAAIAQGYKEVK